MQPVAKARARVEEARSPSELQAALTELASALYEADAEESLETASRSLALAAELGDPLACAWALHNRGWALNSLGRLDEALADQLAALDEFESKRDDRGTAHALIAIGDIHGEAGDTASALEYFDRAGEPMARADDQLGQGVMLNLTGIALSREARHREAAEFFTQAEKTFETLADSVRVVTAQINRGFELLDIAAQEPDHSFLVDEAEGLARAVIDEAVVGGEDGRKRGRLRVLIARPGARFQRRPSSRTRRGGLGRAARPRRGLRSSRYRNSTRSIGVAGPSR